MRAVRIHEHGDESVLRVEEVDRPTPGRDEALVAVHVAAVNPFDTYVRAGRPPPPGGLPHVLGGDAAGVVETVGADVTAVEPGDRIVATGLGLDRPGAHAEFVSVPADRLATLPPDLSFADAAAAAEPVTTSLHALDRGGLAEGDVCLVQGATGGVGHAAVQVARHAGAFVVASCRPAVADLAREFGAHATVDYRSADLAGAVRDATDGRPVDVVVETHADANVVADVDVLGEAGAVVVLGEDGPIEIPGSTAGTAKAKHLDLRFVSHMNSADAHGAELAETVDLLATGAVTPAVAATYPLDEVATAHRHCRRAETVGKTLLRVRPAA